TAWNYPPKDPARPSPSPPPSPTVASTLAAGPSINDLDLLDAADSDEERLIESYRRQRLSEMRKEAKSSRRFGSIFPISRDDYTREVTEASKAPEPDEDEKEEDDPHAVIHASRLSLLWETSASKTILIDTCLLSSCTETELEVLLMATNMIDPRKAVSTDVPAERQTDGDEGTEDEDRGSPSKGRGNGRGKTVNQRTTSIRTGAIGKGDDSDSDFDL
ncbi:hypothetical protein BS47DRAFT_1353587, partial [Hydnum rufescens UP504]